ncbi:MAG: Trehalose/maltose import ATP-binding protein MalK [Methanosaeta sp. PtaU1.Bin060]|nr:MAG: Trehalose/maltose import ATP-binding protein MalK [Methanosaeta sp. PtaU1.Bin060]
MSSSKKRPILGVDELSVSFQTSLGEVLAADEVSFRLHEDETLALVGETGCGKSVVASSILQLLPKNAEVHGQVVFEGRDILRSDEREMSHIRGSKIAVIFQNPSMSLNPIIRVGEQVAEPLQVHRGIPRHRSVQMALDHLNRMGLRGDTAIMYPFQFSGGMNQRVMIATSMILSPQIIIADEPTKGLDDALARDVVSEVMKIRDSSGAALLLITHDLQMARDVSDRVAVMYCGQIVEMGSRDDIFENPQHPYTAALLNCLPEKGFQPIPGSSPSMIHSPDGCKFHPRCQKRFERCRLRPPMEVLAGTKGASERQVRCWLR